jgi:3-methyladenine DNA glycosylase/8-oxoguanine DNA glycosylase
MVDHRVEVRPAWPFRLPQGSAPDGVLRVRGGVVHRLVPVGEEPVVVRVAQLATDRVLFGAQARGRAAARAAIERMRFALGVDDDLRPFYDRFRRDPLIGGLVRARPWLRVRRRPEPFEALAWAITEQLIDFPRAAAIQRRMVWRLGPSCPETGLRAPPGPAAVAAAGSARLEACDLGPGRARSLAIAAREVASGRIDLGGGDHELAWRRLRRIPGIGSWTVELLALQGHGRYDQVPAGDLNFLKLVGRMRTGNPHARGTEDDVRELFAPYGEWKGLAGAHLMGRPGHRAPLPGPVSTRSPARRGTRSSAPRPRSAAA